MAIIMILSGVTITAIFGEDGLIQQGKSLKQRQQSQIEREEEKLNQITSQYTNVMLTEGNTTGNGDTGGNTTGGGSGDSGNTGPTGLPVGTKATENTTINGQTGTYQNPTIPEGYYAKNVGEAIWDGASGPAYNKGLVITDATTNGNEWVWVPVQNVTTMYTTSATALSLAESTGVKTTKYSKSGIISGQTRTTPGSTSGYREPDLATGDNATNARTAGFTSLQNMASTMVSEYEEMLTSIQTYGGFYIGRYELTANGEKPGTTLVQRNWYQLYANCKQLGANAKVKTRMLFGNQWDVTCNWLASSRYSITNSGSWGNYSGTKRNTGYSDTWKANNIYDLAGNCDEWTQEVSGTIGRAVRGGSYGYNGSTYPASSL